VAFAHGLEGNAVWRVTREQRQFSDRMTPALVPMVAFCVRAAVDRSNVKRDQLE
jgi:hypothetical protein